MRALLLLSVLALLVAWSNAFSVGPHAFSALSFRGDVESVTRDCVLSEGPARLTHSSLRNERLLTTTSSNLKGRRRSFLGGVLSARAHARKAFQLRMSEASSNPKEYRVVDNKKDALVVLPLSDDVTSKNIECKITRRSLLLTVDGRRLIDGATWGKLDADESFWEIDEFEGAARCLLLRLRKDSPADWPFLLRSDYELPRDFAGRSVVSRGEVDKEDVEAALQVLVRLLRPDGPRHVSANATAGGGEEVGGEAAAWEESLAAAKREAWRDAAEDMKKSMQQGDPDEVPGILEATQNAVQAGSPSAAPAPGPVSAFVFVRHSTTAAAADGSVESDLARQLTPDGQTDAHAARRWLGTLCREGAPPHGIAVSSSAGRCLETAFLMGAPQPVVLEGLYEGINTEEARAAFAAEGYASVAQYITNGHGKVLRAYAERVLVELADALQVRIRQQREEEGSDGEVRLGCVAVFGHAVYSAAAALLLAQALRLPRRQTSLLAQATHGEGEGLVVSAEGTGHCTLDSTTLATDVDTQTAETLSGVYGSLKQQKLMP